MNNSSDNIFNPGSSIANSLAEHYQRLERLANLLLPVSPDNESKVIRDREKLMQLATQAGIQIKKESGIAAALGKKIKDNIADISQSLLNTLPLKVQEKWKKHGINPAVVKDLTDTLAGSSDSTLLLQAALTSGWILKKLCTDIRDCITGTPAPLFHSLDMSCLDNNTVNILVCDYGTSLFDTFREYAQQSDILKSATDSGASRITCLPLHLLSVDTPDSDSLQQLIVAALAALNSGLADSIVFPEIISLGDNKLFITDILPFDCTTDNIGIANNADTGHSTELLIQKAVSNYVNRAKSISTPFEKTAEFISGFSYEALHYLQGGSFRASFKPLNENIVNGRIRGIAAVMSNKYDNPAQLATVLKELIDNDVLVLYSGENILEAAQARLLLPEAVESAGAGLQSVCEMLGIPPVLYTGTSHESSRIATSLSAMVKEGGPGEEFSELPVTAICMDMTESCIETALLYAGSGIDTVMVQSEPADINSIFSGTNELCKGQIIPASDGETITKQALAIIDARRKALGIDKARERVLYDMAMRRDLS